MKSYQQLDCVLKTIKLKSEPIRYKELRGKVIKEGVPEEDLFAIIDRLNKDGFIKIHPSETGAINNLYSDTFDGKFFLEEGGYHTKRNKEKWGNIYRKTSTIATVIYSLAVLAVAIWAVVVQMNDNK